MYPRDTLRRATSLVPWRHREQWTSRHRPNERSGIAPAGTPGAARPGGHRRPPRSVDPPPAGAGRPGPDRRLRLRRPEPPGGRSSAPRPAITLLGGRLGERRAELRTAGFIALLAEVVESGRPLILDEHPYPAVRGGARLRRFDVRASAVGDGVAVTWRDATERYEQHRRFELLVDNVADVVLQSARRHPGVGVAEPVRDCSAGRRRRPSAGWAISWSTPATGRSSTMRGPGPGPGSP